LHDADEQRPFAAPASESEELRAGEREMVEHELEAFSTLTDMVYRNLGLSRRDDLAPEEEARAELLRLLRQDPEAREMLKRIRTFEEARRHRD
jgi:tRNA(Ile)-lysidine synthase TilS/MesJ